MKNAASKDTQNKHATTDPFRAITTDYLKNWAGSAAFQRGQTYQRQGYVESLQRTDKGEILAWVQGTRRYAVLLVTTGAGQLDSMCTCPYAEYCKHAVATLLEYQRMMQDDKKVSIASDSDPRLAMIDALLDNEEDMDQEDSYIDYDDEDDPDADTEPDTIEVPAGRGTKRKVLAPWLDDMTKKELLTLIREVMQRHPDMLDRFENAHAFAHLPKPSVLKVVEREIERVTTEEAWWDGWRHTGHLPDYSGVRAGLNALLKLGHADEVVRLGDGMLQKMKQQIETSNDDGMTALEMTGALEPVFAALKISSLTPIQKMLKAHEWQSADEYGICQGLDTFWSQRFPRRKWSEFADILIQQLDGDDTAGARPDTLIQRPGGTDAARRHTDFIYRYRRERLGNNIIDALEKAGREDDALAFCESEAPRTLNFGRLVDLLLARKRVDEAEKWMREGVAVTQETAPGIAADLRKRLRDLRGANADWPFVAASHAEDFFAGPDLPTWKMMQTSCNKAGVWPKVRAHALKFLNTGSATRPGDDEWPLPHTGLPRQTLGRYETFPKYSLLLEIALHEKDLPEVVRLYEIYKASPKKTSWMYNVSSDLLDRIALALQSSHPDIAVSVWNGIALHHIAMTKPREYDYAVLFLKKTKLLLLSLKRDNEWRAFYTTLLEQEKRKRRFIRSAHEELGTV